MTITLRRVGTSQPACELAGSRVRLAVPVRNPVALGEPRRPSAPGFSLAKKRDRIVSLSRSDCVLFADSAREPSKVLQVLSIQKRESELRGSDATYRLAELRPFDNLSSAGASAAVFTRPGRATRSVFDERVSGSFALTFGPVSLRFGRLCSRGLHEIMPQASREATEAANCIDPEAANQLHAINCKKLSSSIQWAIGIPGWITVVDEAE